MKSFILITPLLLASAALARVHHPILRRQDGANCAAQGLATCGLAQDAQTYQCVNTTSSTYSCGGCVQPSPYDSSTNGVNCYNIPNSSQVSCSNGKCVVQSCKYGYTPSDNSCVAVPASNNKVARNLDTTDARVGSNLQTGTKNGKAAVQDVGAAFGQAANGV